MYQLQKVSKSFTIDNKKEPVLHEITTHFKAGDFALILGASGSGKTTLLNIISGLDTAYEGEILYEGQNLKSENMDDFHKNEIGFVFQNFNLLSHLSVCENVKSALYLEKTLSPDERTNRAIQLLTRVGLADHANKYPSQLSGGQKQRVAIARALANDPKVIIADEPTGALDLVTAASIIELLKQLSNEGTLVITVTHDESLMRFATKTVRVKDGRILSDDRIKEPDFNPNQSQNKTVSSVALSLGATLKLVSKNFFSRILRNLLVAFGTSIGITAILLALGIGNGITDVLGGFFQTAYSPNQITSYYQDPERGGPPRPSELLKVEEIKKLKKLYESEGITEVYERSHITGIRFKYQEQLIENLPPTQMDEANLSKERYKTNTVSDGYLLAGSFITAEKTGIVLPASVARELLGLKNSELTKEKVEQLISKPITLVYQGREQRREQSQNDGPIEVETVILGVISPDEEGFVQGVMASPKLFEEMIKTIGIDRPIYTIDAFAKNPEAAEVFIEKYKEDPAYENYAITNASSFLDTFKQFTDIIVYLLAFIAGLSLIVAGVMIAVVLYIGVVERTKEIGVLRSIGYKKGYIKRLFRMEAIYIMLLSNIISVTFAYLIQFIANPLIESSIGFNQIVQIAPLNALATLGITGILGVIFALYPAAKAAKLDPITALRYE
ncbi:hypothetical protein UAY_02310 [Enterococcus moraviensis ATCC BAA-383]|uniref:ABC transporter domain-containing protein n=1 Tax=Enterococcus moraviensis ATCC BAA-383 TaxID=1158609 RepID=R2T1Y9_9ENTE|nr:ABC transporter ATP-binding protein/permease [Enterococcus moraviensis]EOH99041.1 hypothetical protein UAY_02310 [Enterococcus moraviensis ATCC BAA-383]EOT71784.1 hypothetical protein I586_01591 [Enterococcus moraviensis ATCC BAA-383]OJG67903.1 hypothetical protein RV09_GL002014 [Enterococcus moraviensis]